jgi:hypothetical protein
MICPSKSKAKTVSKFISATHRIWQWAWDKEDSTLHKIRHDSLTEDVFVSGRKPNRFHYSHTQQHKEHNTVCSVESTLEGEHFRLTSIAPIAIPNPAQTTFMKVLNSWGNTWLWKHMTITGRVTLVEESIADGMLLAVTDGSYIRELFPNVCSAAFVLECSKGQGRIFGAFTEASCVVNAYRGELLGLMAIHLIILSVNKMNPKLSRSEEIVLECLGALKRVTYLPLYRIPSRCHHSNILKTILVHCRGLNFTTYYLHIKAHQDNNVSFNKLSRKVQLNCICDHHAAKQRMATDGMDGAKSSGMFLLEPVGLFIGDKKMTSNTGDQIRFWAHRQLGKESFNDHKILLHSQFESIDWISIHQTLHNLPRLFQIWAAKQVLRITGT